MVKLNKNIIICLLRKTTNMSKRHQQQQQNTGKTSVQTMGGGRYSTIKCIFEKSKEVPCTNPNCTFSHEYKKNIPIPSNVSLGARTGGGEGGGAVAVAKKELHTTEQIKRWSTIPCNRLKHGECNYGNQCHFFHDKPRIVQHDPKSHEQLPCIRPTSYTVDDVEHNIINLNDWGHVSYFMVSNAVPSRLRVIQDLQRALQVFNELKGYLSTDTPHEEEQVKNIVQKLIYCLKSCTDSTFKEAVGFMMTDLIDSTIGPSERAIHIDTFIGFFALPNDVDRILREYDEHQRSFAEALNADPLKVARRNPTMFPTEEFLTYLSSTLGLSSFEPFCKMVANHHKLGVRSNCVVSTFLAILDVYNASKLSDSLLAKQADIERIRAAEAEAKVKLLRECPSRNCPFLRLTFNILTNQSVFTEFVNSLHDANGVDGLQTLSTVFGPFMTYLSYKTPERVTSKFLMDAYDVFTKSRCVDETTIRFKSRFFQTVHTPVFCELKRILHHNTETSHQQHCEQSANMMSVADILKFMLKDVTDMFCDKVKLETRDKFCQELVRHLLPFAFLIFIYPNQSNMFAGRLNKTFNQEKFDSAMKNPKKSILYWLMNYIERDKSTQCKSLKQKAKPPAQGEHNMQSMLMMMSAYLTDNTEDGLILNNERLFNTLDNVFNEVIHSQCFDCKSIFSRCSEFPLVFKVVNNSVVVVEEFPVVLLCALHHVYGTNENSPTARKFSDIKAVFNRTPTFILEAVSVCQQFPTMNRELSVDCILNILHVKPDTSLRTAVLYFMTLISDNSSDDLLLRAYEFMSIGAILNEIHSSNSYFLSLIDALIVVLLTVKFNLVKLFDIMNAVYAVKSTNQLFINRNNVQSYAASLDENSPNKKKLVVFLGNDSCSNHSEKEQIAHVMTILSVIVCKVKASTHSFHEIIKDILPFILNPKSLADLSSTTPEFAIVMHHPSVFHEYPVIFMDQVRTLFDNELDRFIAGQGKNIQCELRKRIDEISKNPVFNVRLKLFGFTKHISAIIHMLNMLFSLLGLSYVLEYESLVKGFPRTTGFSPEISAKLVCSHIMNVLRLGEEVTELSSEPNSAETGNASEPSPESKTLIRDIIHHAVSAIYRVEIPRETIVKKCETDSLKLVRDYLLNSTSLDDLFIKCLPYCKHVLVRELIHGILNYKRGIKVDTWGDIERIKQFNAEFFNAEFVTELVHTYSTDEEFLGSLKESITSEFWNDSAAEVEVLEPVHRVIIRKQPPSQNSLSCEAGPAPEPEPEEDETRQQEVSEKQPIEKNYLKSLLASNNYTGAAEYMNSCLLTEDEESLYEFLNDDDSLTEHLLRPDANGMELYEPTYGNC